MKNSVVKQKKMVTTAQKLSLGFGDLGYSLVANTFSSYMLFFGNTVMGVSGTLMGVAIAIGTVWDAITDPVMGFISDNTRNNFFGRRHFYILIGTIGMTIANVLLWSVPMTFSPVLKMVWFMLCIIALRTFTTMFQTPVAALSLDMSNDYNERANIQIFKSVFTILGILLPTLLIGVFQTDFYNEAGELVDGRFNPQGYLNFGYLTSACCVLFGIFMVICTYSHVPRLRELAKKDKASPISIRSTKKMFVNFFGALKDKNFRGITIGYMVSMVSASILIAVGFNVFTFTFETTKFQMYMIMASLFIMTIAGQPFWMYISKKYDKRKAIIMGQCISFVGCILLLVMFLFRGFFIDLIHKGTWNALLMCPPLMLAGFGTGVLYSLPVAMIGDIVLIEKVRSGEDKTATYSGFLTFANKTGQAISNAVLGVMLDVIGFQEGSTTQTPQVAENLGWVMCIGVILAVGAGILIFSTCKLKRSEVQEALDKLSQIENGELTYQETSEQASMEETK
ncbi:MAG: MFS transporter [Clostridia bacterium]|nr:MFS transporter [Clostridia bacterium]